MNNRTITLGIILTLFGITAILVIVRGMYFNKTHYAVGNVPQEIINELIPQEISLSSMHPPAIRLHDPLRYGGATSVVSVIEYGDYECEFCRAMHSVLSNVLPSYHGAVRFVFRDFPLESTHDYAMSSAIFARCAGQQGKYWEAHDALMNSAYLNDRTLSTIATNLTLDKNMLNTCRNNPEVQDAIRRDIQESQADGIQSVPLLFIGTQAYDHYLTADELEEAIQSAVSSL